MENQSDEIASNQMILKFPKSLSGFFAENNYAYFDILNDENDYGSLNVEEVDGINSYNTKENFYETAIQLIKLEIEDNNYFWYLVIIPVIILVENNVFYFQIFSTPQNNEYIESRKYDVHMGFRTKVETTDVRSITYKEDDAHATDFIKIPRTHTIIIEVPEAIIKKYDGGSILNLPDDFEIPYRSTIPENYLEDEQYNLKNFDDDNQEDFNEQNNYEEDQNNQSNDDEEDNDDDEQKEIYRDCATYFKKIGDKYYIVYNGNIKPNNLNQIAFSVFYYNVNDGEYYWDNIVLPITLENFAENSDKVIYVDILKTFGYNSLFPHREFKEKSDCQEIIEQYNNADKTDETIEREKARKIKNIIIEIENYDDKTIDNCHICEIDENNSISKNVKISFEKNGNKLIAVANFKPGIKLNKDNLIAIDLFVKNNFLNTKYVIFKPSPDSNKIPCIKFDNKLSYEIRYLDIFEAENITSNYINAANQRNNNEYLNVSDVSYFENAINQKNNKIKRNIAIAIGIVLVLSVAIVTALTFGWALIPALLITKIAIGLGLVSAIAAFIYVAIKSKEIKNNKCQNLGKSNFEDEILTNNDLDENNKGQEVDEQLGVPNNLQTLETDSNKLP